MSILSGVAISNSVQYGVVSVRLVAAAFPFLEEALFALFSPDAHAAALALALHVFCWQ